MQSATAPSVVQQNLSTAYVLRELGIPVHRIGYNQLCLAIARYSQDPAQILTKEVYPFVSSYYGYSDWHPVEHSIRLAILYAWNNGNPDAWARYFPGLQKSPSNKQFIATISEFSQNTPPDKQEGLNHQENAHGFKSTPCPFKITFSK